ncbi:MAG: hypothetical protein IPG25_09190 [Proteobacteria bacterium]|nr:hypothetical protein [Pseudomonadota bacterium]
MKILLSVALLLMSAVAGAQTPPWQVVLTPTLNPLPVGMCGAVHLTLKDPVTQDVPRNPQGYRITMADFDMSVSGGTAAAGRHIDASHYEACGCQGGAGGTATVTARYPAQSLPAASRAPGVSIQQSATFTLDPPKGTVNPPPCLALAANPSPPAMTVVPIQGVSTPAPRQMPQPVATGSVQPAAPAIGTAVPMSNPPVSVAVASAPAGAPMPAMPATAPVTPVNPTGFTASQGLPGEVLLGWNPVPEAEYYAVFGPGLEPGGQRVNQGGGGFYAQGTNKVMVPAFNVPGGLQEWAVASYYPNNVTTPGSEFSRVSLDVTGVATATAPPATSAPTPASTPTDPATSPPPPAAKTADKYMVTITGLRAYQASADDMLSRDGVGDEVYAAAYVRSYDRHTGQLAAVETHISAVHGDVNKFGAQRLQAGTRSATGGIRDGDMIPDGGFIAMRSVPAQASTFPMRIFEGTLVDGGTALLISPSLWEQDGANGYFVQWQQNQAMLNSALFTKQGVHDEIAQKTFLPLKFGMSGNDSNAGGTSLAHSITDTMIMLGGGGVPIVGLLSQSGDRPLGLQENGRDQTALPNHVIVLTREIIEAALARPALGPIPSPVANGPSGGLFGTPPIARVGVIAPKPGVMVLQFEDRNISGTLAFPERPAIYQMFIQVERIP